jgi:hypothetical protein
MRKVVIVLALVVSAFVSQAQSKVFKEVGEEIASTMRVLTQDNALVGYLMFTRLEAVSEDSFAYKISIMDENLNDIGTVNFREQSLNVHSVSFDQDVICISYLKSSFLGKKFKNRRDYKEAQSDAKVYVMTQFLDLTGKIFKTNSLPVQAKMDDPGYSTYQGSMSLKHAVQLKNVPQTGFAFFMGDEDNNYLCLYSPKGEEIWKKRLPTNDQKTYSLFTAKEDIYLYTHKYEGSRVEDEITSYSTVDNSVRLRYPMTDKKTGKSLKVMNFDNDPITHKPYLSGMILNSDRYTYLPSAKQLSKGFYSGVFTITLDGPTKKDVKENFSYWSDASKEPTISSRGRFSENKYYNNFSNSFKDFQGNTYFVGSGISRKIKIGSIISTIVTLPLLMPPMFIAGAGYNKFAIRDAMIVKQTPKGALSLDNTIDGEKVRITFKATASASAVDPKSFYTVENEASKSNFIIMDDVKNITIYNVGQKKVVRTIPHKDGNIRTNVFPAKEGHIMVSEYNKKEKYTRVSIESL